MSNNEAAVANSVEKQYVTFLLNDDVYGIDVSYVQEVTGLVNITKVPNTKSFMKGVLDLRGTVIPLVDMRLRFGFAEKEYDKLTAVIIAQVNKKHVGMIVDAVSNVQNLSASDIQDTYHYSAKVETDCVAGIARTESGITVLLDVQKILDPDEIG